MTNGIDEKSDVPPAPVAPGPSCARQDAKAAANPGRMPGFPRPQPRLAGRQAA